jgi:hypothetical protein
MAGISGRPSWVVAGALESHVVPAYPDQGKTPTTQEHCLILQLAVPGDGLEVE